MLQLVQAVLCSRQRCLQLLLRARPLLSLVAQPASQGPHMARVAATARNALMNLCAHLLPTNLKVPKETVS